MGLGSCAVGWKKPHTIMKSPMRPGTGHSCQQIFDKFVNAVRLLSIIRSLLLLYGCVSDR